jgi:hypothetical protein
MGVLTCESLCLAQSGTAHAPFFRTMPRRSLCSKTTSVCCAFVCWPEVCVSVSWALHGQLGEAIQGMMDTG